MSREKLIGLRRQAEVGLGLLKGGKVAEGLAGAAWDALELVGLVADGQDGEGEAA
jgi:hypothetical protein